MTKPIDTARQDASLRSRVLDVAARRVLVSRLKGWAQEQDLSAPTNCGGYGRIRHFRRASAPGWPDNPLPFVPASRWLGIDAPEAMKAQVFQLAACAWRCWYCFVPYGSMTADTSRSAWFSADELVDAYLATPERPPIVDLSGGSPDLAPEWVAWTLDALKRRGAESATYLWSDDNLSSDRLVRPENRDTLRLIARAENYGKACCLKGYDATSFAFNTRASEDGFAEQLRILAEYAATDLDIYLYLPLVGPQTDDPKGAIARLHERLGRIRPDLPSRTVPLHIARFGAMEARLDGSLQNALERQFELLAHWLDASKTGGPDA